MKFRSPLDAIWIQALECRGFAINIIPDMKRRPRNVLTSNVVRFQQRPEQFAAYALAFLDSAQRLCTILAGSHKKATFERGSVVLHLTAHAVELFLKGAILRKKPEERYSHDHDLEHLHNRYKSLYPARRFQLY